MKNLKKEGHLFGAEKVIDVTILVEDYNQLWLSSR